MRKVRIKKLPQAKAGGMSNGYTNTVPEQTGNFGGVDVREYNVPDISTRRTLGPVNKEEATIEAEKGEVAYGDINGDNFTETYVIGGKRHAAGGTPLNLPPGTFIFSDFRDMMIKDPRILAMFGKIDNKGKSKKGYTPAALAKMYDINKYREILDNKDSDKRDKNTAELMIIEYQDKLGALAIAQESLKDFEQGIPEVARPYMEKRGLSDEDILPEGHPALQQLAQQQGQQQVSQGQDMIEQEQMPPMARFGGGLNEMPMVRLNRAQYGGGLNPMVMAKLNRFIPQSQMGGGLNEMPRVQLNRFMPQSQDGGSANFTPHMMYDDQGGQYPADSYQRHLEMQKMGYGHEQYQKGGSLPKYQKKGEVTYKTYVEDDLPKGTVIRDYFSPFTKVGDYVRLKDGTIRKVKTRGQGEVTRDTKTSKGTIDDYIATDVGRANTDKANAIIAQGIADGTIKELGNGNIRILGTFKPSFQDRIALSKTLNASGKKFGTDKYTVAKQSLTDDYSKSGKKSGSFVAGFTPEDYEKRFMLELMTGQGASDEEAYTRIDEIYADPAKKAQARRMYLKTIDVLDKNGLKDGVELTDDELISDDYYKNNYAEVTAGVEKFNLDNYRTSVAGGDDLMSGFDHFDALGINPELGYENEDPIIDNPDDPDDTKFPQKPRANAPWWLQDEVNIAGNIIDRSRINKYLPWAPGIDLEEADPTFVDPTGAVNAQNAAGNASLQALSQFTGAPAASARTMGIQGQMANQAAQTVNKYDTQNVGIANQFETQNLGIRNNERMMDAQRSGKLFDQNTIANQQYDNAMLQLRREGRGMYNQAVTNRWKTDALNQMYPDYAVNPSDGGQMYHDPNYRNPSPKRSNTYRDAVNYWISQGFNPKDAAEAAKNERSSSQGPGGYDGNEMNIINSQYGQNGGLVMGSNVFPFMFY